MPPRLDSRGIDNSRPTPQDRRTASERLGNAGSTSGSGVSSQVYQATANYSEQDAEIIELQAAKKTLLLSGKVADSFTGYGFTARGNYKRVPNDNKFWFSKTYEVITYEEIVNRDLRRYPSFMLHFIPIFYDLYYQALQARLNNQAVGKLWEDHFKITEAERATNLPSYLDQIRECIVSGVKAHILNDMVNALENSYRSYGINYPKVNLRFDDLLHDYFEIDTEVFKKVPGRMFTYISSLTLPVLSVEAGQYLFGRGNELVKGLPISTIIGWRKTVWEEARRRLSK